MICLNCDFYKSVLEDCASDKQHEMAMKFICDTIVHESIHAAILELESFEACKNYDNISEKVEFWRDWKNGFAQLSLS